MNTAQAVEHVLNTEYLTKYALAKSLGMSSSTSVNQWLRGTRMGTVAAKKFQRLYGIKIDDTYDSLRLSNRTK